MKIKAACLAAMCLAPLPHAAQTPAIPTMDHEPRHHLVLYNEYVKVFDVQVSPGDSIILHSHDQDTVAIAIGEQLVTVGVPGKPDVHQKNADAQVRLQRSGYIHSTHVDGDTPYHTVAVELLRPQTEFHNVCAIILAGEPQSCPDTATKISSTYTSQPLLDSAATRVQLVRVLPHQSTNVAETAGARDASQVIVALDAATISPGDSKQSGRTLKPGDFVGVDGGSGPARVYQNRGGEDARFIEIIFPRIQ